MSAAVSESISSAPVGLDEAASPDPRSLQRPINALARRVEDHVALAASSIVALKHGGVRGSEVANADLQREHARLEATLEELRRTQQQLLQAQKMESIGQLAAGIAHEINTPTQYVNDNVSFLQSSFAGLLKTLDNAIAVSELARRGADIGKALAALDAGLTGTRLAYVRREIPRAIDEAHEGIVRIAAIVGAMKEFSHPSQGRKSPVNLVEAISTTITVARNEWKYVARMETDFAHDLPPVYCIRDQINQVVLNMIVNAAHAIEARRKAQGTSDLGQITIAARRDGDVVELCIGDDGCGMTQDVVQRVFEPFFTTKPVGKGTGQGLALAYAVIIERHKGSIDVRSEPGRGTTFIVRLPLTAGEVEETQPC